MYVSEILLTFRHTCRQGHMSCELFSSFASLRRHQVKDVRDEEILHADPAKKATAGLYILLS